MSLPERYVELCLRIGTHDEDFIDAYIGPGDLKDKVRTEGTNDPSALHAQAIALLDELPSADLEDERRLWFEGQLRALECVTARLAGEDIAWSDEVERCFGIRPERADEAAFEASHERLAAVLPGSGDLATGYNDWIESNAVPRELMSRAITTVSDELRRRSARLTKLPDGEGVDYEIVTDESWLAFNHYRGDLRSLVEINVDLPISIVDLVDLIAHESYPGHHAERACKEHHLYRGAARFEMCVMVATAPETVITEGIATNALRAVLADDGFGAVGDTLSDLGLDVDPEVADVYLAEYWALFPAASNAARMLHEEGASDEEAEAYLRRWALESEERAAKTVSFLKHPASKTYITSYTDGRRLCGAFIESQPDGFARLLTEQLTVASLLEATSS